MHLPAKKTQVRMVLDAMFVTLQESDSERSWTEDRIVGWLLGKAGMTPEKVSAALRLLSSRGYIGHHFLGGSLKHYYLQVSTRKSLEDVMGHE